METWGLAEKPSWGHGSREGGLRDEKNRNGCPMGAGRGLGKTVCVSTQTQANRDHCLQLQAPANYALGFQDEQVRAAKC